MRTLKAINSRDYASALTADELDRAWDMYHRMRRMRGYRAWFDDKLWTRCVIAAFHGWENP